MSRTWNRPPRTTAQRFRPELFALEDRMLLASGSASASTDARFFVQEIARSLTVSPLPDRMVRTLEDRVADGMPREVAIRRILATPQSRQAMVQGLYDYYLDRTPTRAESRRLAAGLGEGFDIPSLMFQIVGSPEYFRSRGGGGDAGFVQAATRDLLHRDATALDSAAFDRSPTRGHWLRIVLNGDEFRGFQVDYQRLRVSGEVIGDEERTSYRAAFRGPGGYTRMLARVLGSEAASRGVVERGRALLAAESAPPVVKPVVKASPPATPKPAPPAPPKTVDLAPPPLRAAPTLEENPGLSAKRIPGFLAGYKQDNLATPYDEANIAGRTIDDRTVDYWTVTLNLGDSVLPTILPVDGTPLSDYLIRAWGPDDALLGSTAGGQASIVAPTAGAYTLGISTTTNADYAFDPTGAQPTPAGPSLHAYTAEFETYPGPNTNTLDVLQNYSNPAYTDNNWPAWVGGQAAAFATLTTIATAGSNAGDVDLQNFTDFRFTGDETDPDTITGWLTRAWMPFQTLLGSLDGPGIIKSFTETYGYTSEQWTTIAEAFIQYPATQAAYISVNELIMRANSAREAINGGVDSFLQAFSNWAGNNVVNLLGEASFIAEQLQQGLTSTGLSQAATQEAFWDDLIDIFGGLIEGAVGFFSAGAGVIADGVVSGIVDVIEQQVNAQFDNGPIPTQPDLNSAAEAIQTFAVDQFDDSFDLLSSSSLITSIFSNYGRLEALGRISFAFSPDDRTFPRANTLRRAYDTSVWKQLVPRMFRWVSLANTPASSMPGPANFFLDSTVGSYENPSGMAPCDCDIWDKCWWSGYCEIPFTDSTDGDSFQQALDLANTLQNGGQTDSPAYDFSAGSFGPGPIVLGSELQGLTTRFYSVSLQGSALVEALSRRQIIFNPKTGNSLSQPYGTASTSFGTFVQDWALLAADDKEISADAARLLFGAIPPGGLAYAASAPVQSGAGYYIEYAIPAGGLVTRYDVFSTWGRDVPGFGFSSLSPIDRAEAITIPISSTDPYNFSSPADLAYVTSYRTA